MAKYKRAEILGTAAIKVKSKFRKHSEFTAWRLYCVIKAAKHAAVLPVDVLAEFIYPWTPFRIKVTNIQMDLQRIYHYILSAFRA